MEHLEGAWKLERISPRAYQHPADRAATAALAKVPYLDQVVRKLVALGYERALRAASLGAAVRLGQDQLPHIWVLHRQCFNALDYVDVPDLYLTQFPLANAAAHVHSGHVLYQTALLILLQLTRASLRIPLLAGLPLLAIELALLEW